MSGERTSILSRFILGTASAGFGTVVTIVLGFLCIIIYTRWLPKEEYGVFVLLQVVIALVTSISGFGIEFAITKYLASSEEETISYKIINTVINYRILTLVFTSLVLLVVQIVIVIWQGESLFTTVFLFLPVLVIVEAFSSIYQSIYMGLLRFQVSALVEVVYSVFSFVLTVATVIWLGQGVMGLIYVRIFSRGISVIFGLLSARLPYKTELDLRLLKKMLRFGLPLYINYFLDNVFSKADRLIIGGFLGPAQIALYEIAHKVPESLEMLYSAFFRVYFPIVIKVGADGDREKVSILLDYSNRILTFVVLLGALGIFCFRNEITVLLFSEQYLGSAPIFALIMFALALKILDNNLGGTLVAVGDPGKPPIINTFRALLGFAGYFTLIPGIGTVGAVIAKIGATAAVNPANVFFLRRRGVSANMMVYLKPILLYLIFIQVLRITGWHSYWLFALFLGLYILIGMLLSIITVEEGRMIFMEVLEILSKFILGKKSKQSGGLGESAGDEL